ncbi:MAG: alpha-L-fucosidase [Cellulophaga sp.]|uniref:alpha-L-fucosidase n=1 Tax=unclassified Cellulophaga TaxID=2634405 RepID=UPI000C2C80A2|nr:MULTISPECIES: alpha-L-fucosidase [unclassified Cellulophaga]MDO6492686.1 alpha-L-fucosidase [Cellulophaga sp. 2_MG-2023]MDO6495943.1 alpha-L-fucosidase [Cellulophaga sp. 3_MG-2023]PKB43529.1 alpha-L-fucosidase [Cellulophaga sp. RHA19]
MKYRKYKVLSFFIVSLAILSCADKKEKKEVAQETKPVYEANWESIKKNYKDPTWFNEKKFGIFIHWGPYSVPEYSSEWYPRKMYMDTATFSAQLKPGQKGPSDVYLHHKKEWGDQKEFGYKDFIPMFKGENFNANEWIDLFKKSGAKYVIPVAEHHDGFAMYKSNVTRWNAVDMGPKRDILGELFKAGRQKGMIMGASSHFAFNWSFFNKKDHFDTTDPAYADLYSTKGKNLKEPVSKEFKEIWWARTKDIIDSYQPDIMWFDFYLDIPDFADQRPKLAAYYYNKGIEWGKEVVLQDKNFSHEAFPEGTVIYDLERGKLPGIRKLPWQTDTSIGKNSWSYVSNWESKTANQIVDDLVDIVSKNGNLLLNVGPKSDGTIPEDQKEILLQIGDWLAVNGEAIYDTKYWKTFGEGPTEVKKGHHSEGNNKDLSSKDIRFTTKENKLYAIVLAWPKDGIVTIESLAKEATYAKDLNITNARVLGSKEKIKWSQEEGGLKVIMPKEKPGDFAYVIELEM